MKNKNLTDKEKLIILSMIELIEDLPTGIESLFNYSDIDISYYEIEELKNKIIL